MILKYPWLLSQSVADNVEETFKFLDSNKVFGRLFCFGWPK